MKVCFTDAAKGVIQDKKAMAALTTDGLILRGLRGVQPGFQLVQIPVHAQLVIKDGLERELLVLLRPFQPELQRFLAHPVRQDGEGESQETLAERYYKEGDLPSFKTVFAGLDRPEQAAWMTKM